MIGAGAVVTKDVPDFACMVGIGKAYILDLKNRGKLDFDKNNEVMDSAGSKYRLLINENIKIEERVVEA
jgi:serine acetyltransferase